MLTLLILRFRFSYEEHTAYSVDQVGIYKWLELFRIKFHVLQLQLQNNYLCIANVYTYVKYSHTVLENN